METHQCIKFKVVNELGNKTVLESDFLKSGK